MRALTTPGPVLLVDVDGDVPAMLGLADPDRPGVLDWLTSSAPLAHLDDLLVEATPNCSLLPATDRTVPAHRAASIDVEPPRWDGLVDWFGEWSADTGGSVVIDAGTQPLPRSFVEQCPRRWLVTRACYVALRRAGRHPITPTGVVLVDEPGHPLSRRDVEISLRAPIVTTVRWDVSVARAVDGGLLLSSRLPRSLHRSLGQAAA